MDTMHPAILNALESDEKTAHEGDSTFYVRLAMAAFDLNARLQRHRNGNRDAVWHTIGMAMLSLNMHVDAQRITTEQRDRLKYILADGIEEPTESNDVPVSLSRL